MLSTPPTRRGRFMVGGNPTLNDDSPILSQESINISWKWNNESTPVRSTNKVSKLRQRSITNAANSPVQQHQQQLQHLKQLAKKRNGGDSPGNGMKAAAAAGTSAASNSTTAQAEPENNSPKGMYKFQEEMRKIQFDESDTSCDNFFNDKSMTVADTGYPINADQTNASYSDNLDIDMEQNDDADGGSGSRQPLSTRPLSQPQPFPILANDDANLANDLFNDSDFDSILLTCQIPVQKSTMPTEATTTTTKQTTENMQSTSAVHSGSQLSVKNVSKKASSAPEIKTQNSNSDSCGSNWNLILEDEDDCFDDLVKDFDIPTALNTSAKFTRHKSMPQPQPQAAATSSSSSSSSKVSISVTASAATVAKVTPQQSNIYVQSNFNRKSFTRHESMPISNHGNRFSVASTSTTSTSNYSSTRPNSSMPYLL